MVKSTMLVLLSSLYIAGCSSTNWVKVDNSDFSSAELESALKACNYREAMKKSNKAMLGTSQQVRSSSNVSHHELDQITEQEVNKAKDDAMQKANSDVMHKNMNLAKDAYKCVENKGFIIKS
ncbi:hypothetical protein KO505_06800 [Psychrosphaera sp. F3M07]|uniref:hypothetical protein n=1 Tax=Psychrosphaera sp. F3M07 TaxID=2841560 RepID=UPI001C09599D|nr:hypothetical protein [Psychrosphaera sp. F3M07]MBU2917668.1 hypothetical protein [Psychrosphaera sp. F3M07]